MNPAGQDMPAIVHALHHGARGEMLRRMAEETTTADAFRDYLVLRHDGELFGEAIFAVMAEAAQDARHRYKLRVLEALERETKNFLARALELRGVRAVESEARRKEGEELGRKLARAPWELFMKGFRPELVKFVTEFEQAEALATNPAELGVARHVTAHERALLEFTDRELAGRTSDSPEPVLALLADPPRPPAETGAPVADFSCR